MATATTFNTESVENFFKKGLEGVSKSMDEMSAFSKDNMDAVMQSATVTAKGVEGIVAEVLAYAKQSLEDGTTIAKDFSSVKSFEDFINLQSEFSKSAFEGYVAEMTKLGDMMIATSKDAFEPINARLTALGGLFQKAA